MHTNTNWNKEESISQKKDSKPICKNDDSMMKSLIYLIAVLFMFRLGHKTVIFLFYIHSSSLFRSHPAGRDDIFFSSFLYQCQK